MGKALLIVVVGFSTIMGTMMFNVSSTQQLTSESIVDHYEAMIERNARESVTNVAVSKALRASGANEDISVDGVDCEVQHVDATGDSITEATKDHVQIVCTYEGVADTTDLIMIRPAYSYYAYFVDEWPSHVVYETGDTLVGNIHANDDIKIDGNPVFYGKVSSTGTSFSGSGSPKVYGGIEFGTETIDMPDNATLTPLIDVARAGGRRFTGSDNATVVFNSDSTYTWTHDGNTGTEHLKDINGTMIMEGTHQIHISGVLNGRLTIIAEDDIVIDNSITYFYDPNDNSSSANYLGLVAMDDIIIESTFSDVEIHAAMIALDDLQVRNYTTAGPRGTLRIFGSLTVLDDKPAGVVVGSTLISGFRRIHEYDIRLVDNTPPYFPRLLDRQEVTYRSN